LSGRSGYRFPRAEGKKTMGRKQAQATFKKNRPPAGSIGGKWVSPGGRRRQGKDSFPFEGAK